MERSNKATSAEASPRQSARPGTLTGVAELTVLRWLVPLALVHGLLYMLVLPPWQHYDETAHFLYAAEVAAGEVAVPGLASVELRRAIASSMYRFRFYPPDVRPDLLGPEPPAVGISQRLHPPLYYTLAAVPLYGLVAQPVEQQLYAARAVSVVLYLLTVIAAWRIAVVIAPDDPLAQRLFPVIVLLSPAFADIMTSVNNDVLLNFSLTVAMLGAVLLVRDGLRPLPLTLALLGLAVAFLTKRTAVVAAIPMAVAVLWSVWRSPVRWWVPPLLGAAAVAALGVAILQPTVVDGPSGPHTVLGVRPWFAALDESYLRLYADLAVRSFTDPDLIGDRYQTLVIVAFGGFYTHFAWGQVTMSQAWTWVLAGLCIVATVGLVVGGLGRRERLPLWQRRCLWLFLIAVVVAWFSLFVRIHPLPPVGTWIYFPRARYMFWTMIPALWLLVLGLSWATPAAWRRVTLLAVVGFFALLDTAAWLLTAPQYFYR